MYPISIGAPVTVPHTMQEIQDAAVKDLVVMVLTKLFSWRGKDLPSG